ncbi:MAG: hypothetical protein QXW35_03875 [Candidatus Aenigmatarchaeota archaeon]
MAYAIERPKPLVPTEIYRPTEEILPLREISNLERILEKVPAKKPLEARKYIDFNYLDTFYADIRYADAYYDVYTDSDPSD